MTDPELPSQGDREAAADAVKAYRGQKNNDWQRRIREGQCDDGEMVQAFTRHRTDSTRALVEALEKCRDQFAFYAREHTAAGKTEKAATNQRFADLATAALNIGGR